MIVEVKDYRNIILLYFITARHYASAVYAIIQSSYVCPSVRLSVFLSQVGTVPKRLNIGSRKQRRAIARGL